MIYCMCLFYIKKLIGLYHFFTDYPALRQAPWSPHKCHSIIPPVTMMTPKGDFTKEVLFLLPLYFVKITMINLHKTICLF